MKFFNCNSVTAIIFVKMVIIRFCSRKTISDQALKKDLHTISDRISIFVLLNFLMEMKHLCQSSQIQEEINLRESESSLQSPLCSQVQLRKWSNLHAFKLNMNNTCILIINTHQIKVSYNCLERKRHILHRMTTNMHFFFKSLNEIFERKM